MSKMNLNELRDKAYKTACEHGFHDQELSNNHFLCLVISELMEAVEADRKGRRAKIDSIISFTVVGKSNIPSYLTGSVEME